MNKEELKKVFQKFKLVKLVYLFGSKANNTARTNSDYDFAVYCDSKDKKKMHELKINLINELSEKLKSDDIDLTIINTTDAPELKYKIVKEGKLIYEEEPYKIIVEPKIMNEYFDFYYSLKKYKLTKA